MSDLRDDSHGLSDSSTQQSPSIGSDPRSEQNKRAAVDRDMGSKKHMLSVVEVPFHGEALHAVQDEAGEVWVSIRRVCEVLGVDMRSQLRRLAGEPWSTVVEMTMVAEDGKNRDVSCIRLGTLPMWLGGIKAGKVAPGIRQKLLAFQLECHDVLRDYFFRGGAVNPGITQEQADELAALANRALSEHAKVTAEHARLNGVVVDLTNIVAALQHELDTNLGTCGAAGVLIRSRINAIARVLEPDGKKRRSVQMKTDQKIRNACEWPRGQGRSWENMPRAKAPAAKVVLDQLEHEADEAIRAQNAARQTSLFDPATLN